MVTFINLLTFSRIVLAAIIFLLLMSSDGYLLALILFYIAGFTDWLDGFLARKYNAVSQLGEILDPIADKILIVFVFFARLNDVIRFVEKETLETSVLYAPVKKIVPTLFPNIIEEIKEKKNELQ